MYINRSIDKYLEDWKKESNRKPLMIRGARQIGKSTSIRKLGESFEYFVEVNFDELPEIATFFKGNLDVKKIIEQLSIFYNVPIEEGKTLIFFDEIQNCKEAINSLRYFYEKLPELHIIATGSLLEFAFANLPSFGVGRIKSLFMYPISFDEFLMALEERNLLKAKQNANSKNPLSEPIHNKLVEYLFTFILIGGMPEVVKNYAEKRNFIAAQEILTNLNLSFQTDFSKYKKRVPRQRIIDSLMAVAVQTGSKFVLSKIPNTNSIQARESLHLLQLAGLVLPITHSSANGIPLGAEAKHYRAKMILVDTGLYQNLLDIQLSELILDIKNIINKGALAECFWGLEYIKYQSPLLPPNLYYWHREARNANAEVDYIIQKGKNIIPIEIKSSNKGSMQSLHLFMKEKNSELGYRFSLENYNQLDKINIIPLYGISSELRSN
jgi:uncharacterized protein